MDTNNSNISENTPGNVANQRKNGVIHNSSETEADIGVVPTVPPPYTEVDETSRNVAVVQDNNNTTKPYTVPKDVSNGLTNPVFNYTENPDQDPTDNAECNSSKLGIMLPPSCPQASFTSLNSYGPYASQTTLCHKTHLENYNHADFDAEKWPSPSTIKENPKSEKANEKGEYKGMKKYAGMLLTLSASFFFSVVVLFVKILKDYNFDAYGASFWRYLGTVIPTIPLLFFYECGPVTKKHSSIFQSVWPIHKNGNWKTWIGLLSRGLIGSTSVILRYYALQYLTIGDTSVITYSTPVLVTVMAHFFLGERCGVFPVIVAIVTLCGVIIVTKPPILTGSTEFDTNTLIGTGLACGSLFCSALIVIITRKIREVHFTIMTMVFGVIGVAQALTLIYFLGHFNLPTELYDSLLVAGVASLSFLGQMSIVLALKFEQAGPVALIRSCDVLFGFLFQYVFLSTAPDVYSAVGAIIVLTGVLSTGFRKWLNTLSADDKRRKTWRFILK